MMKRNIRFILFLFISVLSFGKTEWTGDEGRIRIIYKLLDPLIVKFEQPKPIKASTLDKKFTYSSKNSNQMIKVDVQAPYITENIDEYLRAIYQRVYFKLDDDGVFKLKNEKVNQNIEIMGKGYFVDHEQGITAEKHQTEYDKDFKSNVAGNAFTATTNIDAEFTLPDGEIPMGVYRGKLILKVWFSGGLK